MTEEIKRGPGRPRKDDEPRTVSCVVLRDYWPTENSADRVRAGTVVELDPMDALDKVEAGMVRRVK